MKIAERLLVPGAISMIVGLTIAGLVAGTLRDPLLDPGMGALLVAILLVIGVVSDVLLPRFVILPGILANEDGTTENAASAGYALATSPAVYGLAAAVMTGRGLLVLPFGAIALAGVFVVRSYLQEEGSRQLSKGTSERSSR